jgi:hypothetical protein
MHLLAAAAAAAAAGLRRVIQGLMVDEGDSDDEDAALAKPLLRSQGDPGPRG